MNRNQKSLEQKVMYYVLRHIEQINRRRAVRELNDLIVKLQEIHRNMSGGKL